MALQQGYSLYGGQLTRRGVEEDPALFLQDSGKENVFDSLSRDNGGSLTVTGRHEYLDTQDLNAAFSAASRAAPGVSDAALGRLNDDLSARQRLITERISQTEKLLEEARANRDKAREELKKNSGFLAWLSGEKKALEKQLEAAEALFQAVGKQYDEQNKALADSKSFAADALRLREQGLASGGSGAASQQTLADAKTTFVRARSVLGVQDSVELESHVKALEAAGKEYERALGCRNTINVVGNCILRGAIIAGATILTAPMGGWGGFAAGVALATVGIGAVNGTKLALKAATGEKVSGADLKAAALDTLYGAGEAALCGFGGLLAGAYARAAQAGVSAARLSTAATNAGRGIALGQNLTRSVNVFSRMSSLGRVWHAARTLRTGGLCGLIASAPSTVFHTAMDFWRPVSEGGLKRPDGWRFYDVLARVGCNLGLSYVLGATGARWSAYRHALWDSATQQGRHIATRTTGYVARHMLSHTGEAVSTTVSTFLSAHLQARMMGRYLTDAEKAQIVLSGFMGLFMGSAAEQIGRRQMMQLAQSTAVTHNYANDQARRSHYESMMRGQRIDCDVETTRSPVQLCSFDRRAGRATCHTQTDLRRQNVSAEAMGSSVYRQQQLALDRQAGRPIRQTVTESRRAAADIVRSRARNQQPWEDQVVFARYLGDELDQVHSRFSQLRRARLNADSFDDASVSLLAEFSERNNRSAKGFRQPMPEDA
ncbi:MAG TPA: hypothetical protein PLP17_00500, partial [Oligoflexia bacterium]|nr:hypothetical protein [Oligoflexia bacterium]